MSCALGGLLVGVGMMVAAAVAAPVRPPDARADLEELARRRVFFGHQSVGQNVMDGLQALAAESGLPVPVARADAPTGARGVVHGLVPRNGDPLLKLASFERLLGDDAPVDVALVKLCYVDVEASTDVRALFEAEEAMLARLAARHPRVTFVRVTVPLTTVQRGPKALVKRVLGRGSSGVAENARREELNELLRTAAKHAGAPLFDLARIESTRPDGSREVVSWSGREVPALVSAYASDEGHLNADGRLRAARELAAVLARAPLQGASAPRAPEARP